MLHFILFYTWWKAGTQVYFFQIYLSMELGLSVGLEDYVELGLEHQALNKIRICPPPKKK